MTAPSFCSVSTGIAIIGSPFTMFFISWMHILFSPEGDIDANKNVKHPIFVAAFLSTDCIKIQNKSFYNKHSFHFENDKCNWIVNMIPA